MLSADFTASSLLGFVSDSIVFTDLSSGASSWLWNFGDGATSTAQNPSHQYQAPGSYDVTLEINSGLTVETKPGFITILDKSVTPESGRHPLRTSFMVIE